MTVCVVICACLQHAGLALPAICVCVSVGAPVYMYVGGPSAYMDSAFVKCWLTSLTLGGASADEPTFA